MSSDFRGNLEARWPNDPRRGDSLKAAGNAAVQGGRNSADPTLLRRSQAGQLHQFQETLKLPPQQVVNGAVVSAGASTKKPASKIRTVMDDVDDMEHKKLSSLESRVKQISSHLEEEIRARAKQRLLLQEMHEEELRKVEIVGEELDEQMEALVQFVVDFKRKYSEHLHGTFDELQGQLDDLIEPVFPRLAALEARAMQVRCGIEEERQERLRESERVLVPLRAQLKRLAEELETENEIRKTRTAEIEQKMREAAEALSEALSIEEAAREHKHAGLSQEISYDKARLEKKQSETVQKTCEDLVSGLSTELQQEQDERVGTQDPIVKLLTNFVEQLQADIKERAGS